MQGCISFSVTKLPPYYGDVAIRRERLLLF
eukprot:UN04945